VKPDLGANVDDLAMAVIQLLGDDFVGIAPNILDVYKNAEFANLVGTR
jgi:hypothetical protein